MTLDDLRIIVRNVTYKPGHRIDLKVDLIDNRVGLALEFPVLDVETGLPTKVMTTEYIPETMLHSWRSNDALEFIFDAVVRMETHEVKEWLKHRKLHIVHPHPEVLESYRQPRPPPKGFFRRWW